jgi:hypothetical protein
LTLLSSNSFWSWLFASDDNACLPMHLESSIEFPWGRVHHLSVIRRSHQH